MARGDYEVSVRIERDTPTRTNSGGETQTESTIASGVIATKHFHSNQRLARNEATPGTQTVTELFFKLPAGTDVLANDRIVEEVQGAEWLVKFVRPYSRTTQVDVEHVSQSSDEAYE